MGAERLILIDVDAHGLEGAAADVEEAGVRAERVELDLADIAAVETCFRTALPALGPVDILYNNAGIVSGAASFPHAGRDGIQRIIDVNLTSLVLATELTAHHMAARGGGVIVNTVSTVALGTGFYDVLYATTKAGVHMFTQACSVLSETHNVRVLGVLPGLVATPILYKTGGEGIASDWMKTVLENNESCEPDDIAQAVVDMIRRDDVPGGSWVAVRREAGETKLEWSDPALA